MILERAIFAIKHGMAEQFANAFALARPHIEAARGFHKLEMRQGIEKPETCMAVDLLMDRRPLRPRTCDWLEDMNGRCTSKD